jgi:aspartate kinase
MDAGDLQAASEALNGLDISETVQTDERVGKVSVVGAGMRSHPGVAAMVFRTLGENGINIEMIATSPIKISCVIDAENIPSAVQALHEAFELGSDAVRREEPTGTEHRPRVAP